MTIEHKKPDFDEAMQICRHIMEGLMQGEYEMHQVEIRLQRLAVALGRNPALIYPDYDTRNGPDYWYECINCENQELVFSKSQDDWICPFCNYE